MEETFLRHTAGAFIYSENPIALAEWYQRHLGVNYKLSEVGAACFASFFYPDKSEENKASFAWSIIKSKYRTKTDDEAYIVKCKVGDLKKMEAHLASLNVMIEEKKTHPKGHSAWIKDPEGNLVELWEEAPTK